MAERLKVDDLKKIKEKVQAQMSLREGEHRAKINVHMGTCGIAAGARKVMTAFLDEIAREGLTDIIVIQSGCAGLCKREPMATIDLVDQAPVKYVELDEEKAKRIFNDHVLGGKIVDDFALARGSETLAG